MSSKLSAELQFIYATKAPYEKRLFGSLYNRFAAMKNIFFERASNFILLSFGKLNLYKYSDNQKREEGVYLQRTEERIQFTEDGYEAEELRKRALELKQKNVAQRKYTKISKLFFAIGAVLLIIAIISLTFVTEYYFSAKRSAQINEKTRNVVMNIQYEDLYVASSSDVDIPTFVADIVSDSKIEETCLPTIEENSAALMVITSLRDTFANDDIIGYLKMDGTNIDYAVAQSSDNDYYLSHDLYLEKSAAGSIFMDFECDPLKLSNNTVIYGHNMRDGTMFHNLRYFADEKYFAEHRYISLTTTYGETKWEIFAYYETSPDFYYIQVEFQDEGSFAKLVSEMKSRSVFDTDTIVGSDDKILTLSTCANAAGDTRLVINAKLIAEDFWKKN